MSSPAPIRQLIVCTGCGAVSSAASSYSRHDAQQGATAGLVFYCSDCTEGKPDLTSTRRNL